MIDISGTAAQNDYYSIIQQDMIDIILWADTSDSILRIPGKQVELKIQGRPLSLQSDDSNNKIQKFKQTILTEIEKFHKKYCECFITNRVQIEIDWYIEEKKLYEDHLLPDTDNILKKLIDSLHETRRGILIDDTQVDKIIVKRTRILPKCNEVQEEHPNKHSPEYFVIRIKPMDDEELFAIKKDEIVFIPIPTPQPTSSDSQRYYPLAKNSQELMEITRNLFIHLNNAQQELNDQGIHQYLRSIGMTWGTFFLLRSLNKNKGFDIMNKL